jgi:hypothetical protein
MEDQTRLTTDPRQLAERALELLAALGYVPLQHTPNPFDRDQARRQFREELPSGRSIQYLGRTAWHSARLHAPPRAELLALAEFAYARAMDALLGDSSQLTEWLHGEEVMSAALAREAARLAPLAREFSTRASQLAEVQPEVAALEAHLGATLAATHVKTHQVELQRALKRWRAARRACLTAQRLTVEILLDGAGLPAERRALSPAPLWPNRGALASKGETKVVYDDLCRLTDAGVELADVTFIAFGEVTKKLKNRVRIAMRRNRGLDAGTNSALEK